LPSDIIRVSDCHGGGTGYGLDWEMGRMGIRGKNKLNHREIKKINSLQAAEN